MTRSKSSIEIALIGRLIQFQRACRDIGAPAERVHEALLALGFDRAIIAEANHRINEVTDAVGEGAASAANADDDTAPLALELTQLLASFKAEFAGRNPSQHRLSVLPGGAGRRPAEFVPHEEVTMPGLTAQLLAEAPLLAAADGAAKPDDDDETDGVQVPPPPFISDVAMRKLMRALPAVLTVVIVAWAALHAPPERPLAPPLHVREALSAPPPAAAALMPSSGTTSPVVAPPLVTPAPTPTKGFSLSPRRFYQRLSSALQHRRRIASVTPDSASSEDPKITAERPLLADPTGKGGATDAHGTKWWQEDMAVKEVVSPEADFSR